jgi:hypothetical protein
MDLKKGLFRVETCHPEVRAKAKGTMKRYFIERVIIKILLKK